MGEQAAQTDIVLKTVYGEVSITEDQVYSFEQGVIGLPEITSYALLPFADSDLFILQSLKDDISFILVPAIKVDRELAFQIDEDTVSLLGVQDPNEIATMLIVHVIDELPFVNCKAPILIVPETQKGCQFVINDANYAVREPLVMKGAEPC